jgi:hypothetical protein
MTRQDINNWFMNEVFSDVENYVEDLKWATNLVASSKAIYKGKPIPFLYRPRFFTAEDLKAFNHLCTQMMGICDKMVKLYKSVPHIRDKYGFDARLEALILKESPYSSSVPMARIDIFYQGPENFMFCEINTDGTSAMNEDAVLVEILGQTKIMEACLEHYHINSFELFDTWVQEVKSIYQESRGLKDRPRVAIVDLIEKSSPTEFEVFKDRFEAAGFECVIADARELSYSDALYYHDKPIDIVYRRLVTKDMMDHIDLLKAFEMACLDDKTLIIGNIQSQVVHTKLFFKLLFDEDVRQHFSKMELDFIDQHIPKTESIKTAVYQLEYYVKNRMNYLIKPLDFYASIGVYAGKDYSDQQWRQLLVDHQDKPYLLQHYCEPPIEENIDLDELKTGLVKGDYKHITGLYVYNRKLYGAYSRAGRTSIISGLHDVFTLPSLFVSEE